MFFSFSGNEDSEDFESFQLYDVERLFWLPAEWPTPLEKPQDLHFLKDKTLLLEIHNECDKAVSACRAHGFEPKEIKYVGTFLLLSYLISTGEGFTIWSRYLPEVFRQRIRIVPFMIDKGVPPTSIFATWRKNDSSEKLAKALTAIRDPSLREPEKDPLGKGFGSRW
jgi:DNA-binding transcriptional LysR family regulator